MNAITERASISVPVVAMGGGAMVLPQTMAEVVEFAKLMSRAQGAIPKHLRDNPGACMAVTMQALRWEADPFAVANKSYFVNDRIAFEAQLIAAIIHTRAPLAKRPAISYRGEGATRQCVICFEFKDGVTQIYESPLNGAIKTKNSPLWQSEPDQQLYYYSIRAAARRYCPEVILGVYAPDELPAVGPDRARDVTPKKANPLIEQQAEPDPEPSLLERLAEELQLCTLADEIDRVLQGLDAELRAADETIQEAARLMVNKRAGEIRSAESGKPE